MNEEVRDAEREFGKAAEELGKRPSSFPLNGRRAEEIRYSRAYQQLVHLRARPQLRKKYRGIL